MTALALTAALSLSASDLFLQSLVPTSGGSADAVLDGKPDTSWAPEGTPADEGILFRFEAPPGVKTIELTACAGDPSARWSLLFDGMSPRDVTFDKTGKAKVASPYNFRTVFLKIVAGKGCVAEVNFQGASGNVRPPRTVHGKVAVSSVLTPADAYHPGYLFDGRTDFGWVEGSKGTGEKEWLEVTLDAPATVTALELWNGYQRSDDHYKKNCRAKKVTLTVDGGEAMPFELKDVQGPQKLTLPKPVKGTAFKLTIDSVVKGTKYTDMVMSELRFWDEQGPLQVVTDDMKQRTAALKDELKGKPLGALLDTRLSSVCGDGLSLKLRSNHTFAVYEHESHAGDMAYEETTVNQVVDGAWIVKSPTSIELFGRRQRIQIDDKPYGGGTSQWTGITGGTVSVTPVKSLDKDGFEKLKQKWTGTPAEAHVSCDEAAFDKVGAAVVFEGVALTGLVAAK